MINFSERSELLSEEKRSTNQIKNFTSKKLLALLFPAILFTCSWDWNKNPLKTENYSDIENTKKTILNEKISQNIYEHKNVSTYVYRFPNTDFVPNYERQKVRISWEFPGEQLWKAPNEDFYTKFWPEQLYFNLFKKLSEQEYKKLFTWFKNVRQWWIWDCYLISAIKILARSKFFDTLMMTSIEMCWENEYTVYMPLWEPDWIPIRITGKDLEATAVRWPIWYKILEASFAKYLLYKEGKIITPNIILTRDILKKIAKWSTGCALQTILWPKSFYNKQVQNNVHNRNIMIDALSNFDPKNLHSISISTKIAKWKTDHHSFKVWNSTIYYNHVYSVLSITKSCWYIESITLDNPWNSTIKPWWKTVTLSLRELFHVCSFMNIWRVTPNFLNLTTYDSETWIVDSYDRSKL